ncbi:4'-phosphopantetheinyl transferase superfamily protein [Crossiella sp. CA-258035]|uniref:4'-phosphopantetheinyl transferase family protein n=1 Tax=Crossiella sp. CA-258035 TaxID=2981138 RepID=UPI0024BD1785|nr:4'-phosphopantetheinyl transferase superfamily protein [Crossiella sp. CA-258035]WHT21621.1 4'-phosphopantetheinyl transferase superfamily protein [Crossiella sp. CA-258035]
MIAQLLPPPVVTVETSADRSTVDLFPAELALVAKSVPKRQAEFSTARWCARQALGFLGVEPAPILPDERGAPQWPAGFVGSITHCNRYRAAAVAMDTDVLSLGIDAEPNEPLPDGVLEAVSLPEERAMLHALGADSSVCWDRLLFSAKESVYKAWYPPARKMLSFEEARLAISADGSFTATLLVPGPTVAGKPLTGFTGRWLANNGIVLTAIQL